MTTFIDKIENETQNTSLHKELFMIDQKSLKTEVIEEDEDYMLGCTYGKGSWITDPDGKVIKQREMPNYYKFLKGWYHLD